MALNLKFVLGFFNDAAHPLSHEDIIRSLSISKEEEAEFNSILKQLLASGDIVKIRGNRYGTPNKMNLVTGKVQAHPDGYGFIIPDDKTEEDLFVSPRQLREAMHDDIVIARKQASRRTKKMEGQIIRIVKRGNSHVIGRFEKKKRFGYLVPLNRSILHDIYIPIEDFMGAKDGDIVSAEIIKYPVKRLNPEGKIVKIFGDINDPDVEIEAILFKYHIDAGFPEGVIKQAERTDPGINEEEFAKRTDLRDMTTFTIDGENAKDFDDAVSIERLKGGYRLLVSIADVSHYVKPKTPLDKEAFSRSTSVYLLNKVVPMLPERLSNDICSLKPKEDRLTFTAEMEFDSGGDIVDYNFYKSVINSDYRLTYTEVKRVLLQKDEGLIKKYSNIVDTLKAMEELALILKNKRGMRGSIDFDLPEADIIIDMQGRPENIIKAERNIAHRIIEEFMLVTNETVARHLNWLDIPCLYRVHEQPDPDKVADFKELAFNLGYHLKITSKIHPKAFQQLLSEVSGQPEEMLINRVMLRTMKLAVYMPMNQGHFALATSDYTHFTSPIRRYPDLAVHRILSDALISKKITEQKAAQLESELKKISEHCSIKEREAEKAEREVIDLKKVQFMSDKIGEAFTGFISGVNSFGFFVELCDILVEGLVHVSSLHDDYYIFYEKEHMLVGKNLKHRFRIGDMISVRLVKADTDKREIDFELIEKLS
jgi:ribonuclease R